MYSPFDFVPTLPKPLASREEEKYDALLDAVSALRVAIGMAQLPAEQLTAISDKLAALEIPQPVIQVDPVDLSDIVTAVNGLKPNVPPDEIAQAIVDRLVPSLPQPSDSLAEVLDKMTDKLETLEFRLRAQPGGGGGGPSNDAVVQAITNLHTDTSQVYATKVTVSGSLTFVAKAVPGTLQSNAAWQVQKIDESSGTVITWADGNANFDNIATDLTALSYA